MTAHYWHPHTHMHMQRVLLISFLIISAFVGGESSISSDELSRTALFGVRGGAFFGKFGRRQSSNSGGGDDDDNNNRNNNSNCSPKRFPPMSQDEIEEKLNIPVFGITDAKGNGVIQVKMGITSFISSLADIWQMQP